MRVQIPVNLDEVKESRPVPTGKYGLTIASVEDTKSKAGAPMLVVSIGIDGHADAPNVTHYMTTPQEGGDPKKEGYKALMIARFLDAFKIPHDSSGFDTDDFPGATATCSLLLSEPSEDGRVFNRLDLPQLREEPSKGGANRASPPKR